MKSIRVLNCIKAKINQKYLYACAALFTIPAVAEASEAGQQLKEGSGRVVGVIMLVAFMLAVGLAVVGGAKFAKGEKESAKTMIIGAGLVAAGTMIAKVLFSSFGMQDATVDASFDL